jgi:hypothetical protein
MYTLYVCTPKVCGTFFVANTFQIQPFHRDWRSRQIWLFVLCQEHNTDIDYQCWLHWHPFQAFATLDKLSHGSDIILGFNVSHCFNFKRKNWRADTSTNM